MSTTIAPTALGGVGQSTMTELIARLIHATSRLQRIRILLSTLRQSYGAERAGLIVAQTPEIIYWNDRTDHPEPYWVDNHQIQLFEPAMAWAATQPSGFRPASAVTGLPTTYGISAVVVLGDQSDPIGLVVLVGSQVSDSSDDHTDMVTGLLTLVTIEQRTTNNLNLFLGDFAHDQRSSLSVLSLSADALNETVKMPEKSQLHLTRIFDNSLQIGIQIENALSVDRYDPETDEYHMQVEQVDLVELRREICDRYIQVAQGKKITFNVPSMRGAATISADRIMVQRAITNLIDNALKFTPEGGTIEVTIVRSKEAMQVVVRDSGPGIAPENRERIFERKVRIRQPRHIRGLGLGLYIVKNVALKHGGQTWVESAPGEGSTFYLTLPVKHPVNGVK